MKVYQGWVKTNEDEFYIQLADCKARFGFVLCEEDGQDGTSLLFPPGDEGATWIHEALTLLERYENELTDGRRDLCS